MFLASQCDVEAVKDIVMFLFSNLVLASDRLCPGADHCHGLFEEGDDGTSRLSLWDSPLGCEKQIGPERKIVADEELSLPFQSGFYLFCDELVTAVIFEQANGQRIYIQQDSIAHRKLLPPRRGMLRFPNSFRFSPYA